MASRASETHRAAPTKPKGCPRFHAEWEAIGRSLGKLLPEIGRRAGRGEPPAGERPATLSNTKCKRLTIHAFEVKPAIEAGELEADAEHSTPPVESLWDLVFVFAVTQVTMLLSHDLTWSRPSFALLITVGLWWTYFDRFAGRAQERRITTR